MSVSVSQIGIDRLARPTGRSITIPPVRVSRSIYLCLSVPVQRTTRPRLSRENPFADLRRHLFPSSSSTSRARARARARSHCPRSRNCLTCRSCCAIAACRRSRRDNPPESCISSSRSQAQMQTGDGSSRWPSDSHRRELAMLNVRKVATDMHIPHARAEEHRREEGQERVGT